jgi:hypothetical protein
MSNVHRLCSLFYQFAAISPVGQRTRQKGGNYGPGYNDDGTVVTRCKETGI